MDKKVIERELAEVRMIRAKYDLYDLVLRMVSEFGESYVIDVLELNIKSLNSLNSEP